MTDVGRKHGPENPVSSSDSQFSLKSLASDLGFSPTYLSLD